MSFFTADFFFRYNSDYMEEMDFETECDEKDTDTGECGMSSYYGQLPKSLSCL